MATSSSFDNDEKPLDPALLRVQAKMRRLMLIAGLTLAFGILVVFAAILYRIAGGPDKAPPVTLWSPGDVVPMLSLGEMGLPAGARLAGTTADGGRLILTYQRPGGGSSLVFIDETSLKVTGRLDLAGE